MSTKKVHFIGKLLYELSSCPSTNAFVNEFLKKEKIEAGSVFFTTNQTDGRGQAGTNWISEPHKNLAFTTVVYPYFLAPSEQIYLNQSVAIACQKLITALSGQNAHIKWPNDIYLNDKKVAGILIQNTVSTKKINTSIIGIGININQSNFPSDLGTATSLFIETQQQFDIKSVVIQLASQLNVVYEQLAQKSFLKLHQYYLDHLYKFQQESLFSDQTGHTFIGKITGINKAGQLLVETSKGTQAFSIKEIKMESG